MYSQDPRHPRPSPGPPPPIPPSAPPQLRRGKSILARDEDQASGVGSESGLALFKRGNTLRRKHASSGGAGEEALGRTRSGRRANRQHAHDASADTDDDRKGFWNRIAPGPVGWWMIYCWLLTCLVPGFVLRGVFGKRTPEAQRAWREKMGLLSIILLLMAFVGFLTFGFTQTVCGTPGNRVHGGEISTGSLIINGFTYDLSTWNHPAVPSGAFNGSQNPLYTEPWNAAGMDASFMFQNVNKNCFGLITKAEGSSVADDATGALGWYFPCNLRSQNQTTSVNANNASSPYTCHLNARGEYDKLPKSGSIYYTWDDVHDPRRNLVVYQDSVLDLSLLAWLQSSQVRWPKFFDEIRNNDTYRGTDMTMFSMRAGYEKEMRCLSDIIVIGTIDSLTIGCLASQVVLYASLIVILGMVGLKFAMAVFFGWFLSRKLGDFEGETSAQRKARVAAIEDWTNDIYQPAPGRYRPNVREKQSAFALPKTSRYSRADSMLPSLASSQGLPPYGYSKSHTASSLGPNRRFSQSGLSQLDPFMSPASRPTTPSPSSPGRERSSIGHSLYDSSNGGHGGTLAAAAAQPAAYCPFETPLGLIPQPPVDFEPFGFPLMRQFMLVTAYSESIEGLRTTLDSLATTDYPNSHKLILVIADGMVKGAGSTMPTPDICLGMMKELLVPAHEVEPHSYVAIADGYKKHNMAKVYAGFYDYDDDTVERSKQQRVPMLLIAKVGTPLEAKDAKPGNRGKRDSQVMLMAFLQKVLYDERMTTFEYELFKAVWAMSGVHPSFYEGVLAVDADTKVFPDSLTRMTATMRKDPDIIGLCGETKIANKAETWVTMIQVFEYYISHHLTKAFEATLGKVTCLPGCFSMYRIKAAKGQGYWIPILASPEIIEDYSENVVDTLHKKNLLLLGEDRYLSTLLLKTFPKRKMLFCPQAVCKTVVPDTFRMLLSQRRRWINSTVHNLSVLVMIRDFWGTFCFSGQFVVFIELVGTLVLPAAIAFTIYIIVIAIIPSQPTPTLSLILLAFILGLPGLLIVITSRKISYVGWMLIYLISLPIWNFVLPAYSYWNMDDFSWGETRKIEGEVKSASHGDKEGQFDSSQIVMKRWAEFERERRWRELGRE